MNLASLQSTLRTFAAERRWEPFHTPKNLAMALMVEAAELAEIFQWMTPEESVQAHGDKVVQDRIADEVADVLLYLLQLADHSAIDLKRAVGRKLIKNAKKHPPTAVGARALAVAPIAPHAHVLVDWENVQPTDEDIRALVPDATDLWVFHGRTQRNIRSKLGAFDENLTLIPIARTGKNALDFHLSFYMGYVASRNPDARFVVVSNDQGYQPMLDHARDLGFAASQVGWVPQRTAAKKAVRGAAGKAAPARPARRKAVPAAPMPAAAPELAPASGDAVQAPARTRRRKAEAPAEAPVTSATAAPTPEASAPPAKRAARKSAARSASQSGAPAAPARTEARATPVTTEAPATPARKASSRRTKAAADAAAVAAPAPAWTADSASAPAPTAAPKPSRSRGRKAAEPTAAAPAPSPRPSPAPRRKAAQSPAQAATPAAVVSDKAYAHVLASLRKARDKPARTARLYSAVRSLLEGGKAGDAAVEAVVQRMIAEGHASPDGKGGVRLTL